MTGLSGIQWFVAPRSGSKKVTGMLVSVLLKGKFWTVKLPKEGRSLVSDSY